METPQYLLDIGVKYDERFNFDKETHKYTWEGREMTGTTTVLKGIKNADALLQWSANCAVEHIASHLGPAGEVSDEVLTEARTAHLRVRDKRKDEGTDTHGVVEAYIKETLIVDGHPDVAPHARENWVPILPFIDWAIANKIRFLGSEVAVYDEVPFVGGIIDFIFEKDGKIFLGDLKTNKRPKYGSGIYFSYWMQLASYRSLLEHMGGKVDGACLVRMSSDLEVQWRDKEYPQDRASFLGALTIYRNTRTYEQR